MIESFFRSARNQSGYWLHTGRLRGYSVVIIVVYVLSAVAWIATSEGLVDPTDKPLGYDFIAFFSASKIALDGDFVAVFDQMQMLAVQQEVIPGNRSIYTWNYPPQFLVVVLPLALLPYVAAFFAWTIASLGLYLLVVHRFAPSPITRLLAAAFPAVLWTAAQGQNGFVLAALFGGAVLLLDRRPILAGVLIGLLTFKPQIGLLIPVALLFGRRWTIFASATATTLAFAALSIAVVGIETWPAFWKTVPLLSSMLEDGRLPWNRMTSLFSGLRMLGAGVEFAYAMQFASALVAAAAVAWVWMREAPTVLKAAVLVAGAPLAPPYVFDYDLVILAIPIAIIAWDGVRRGWLEGEREVLIIAWAAPILATSLAAGTGVQVGYLCVLALFVVAVRRAVGPPGMLA